MLMRIRKNARSNKGAALLEYSLLIAGIALIGAAAIATFGHKTTDMMAAVAAVLPGAHVDDNAPIVSGKIIETTNTAAGTDSGGTAVTNAIGLNIGAAGVAGSIIGNYGTARLGSQAGAVGNIGDLVVEP
jgi:Flp pilus assembly pilin Flp